MRKSLVLCETQLTGSILLKKLKYFDVMLHTFSNFLREGNCRILIGLFEQIFLNSMDMFLDQENKTR